MTEKSVIVRSIPKSLTDEAIEDALAAPYEDDYYLVGLFDSHDGALRAFFKRSANYVDPTERAARNAEDAKAVEVIRSHPELSQARVVGLLAAKGISRTSGWVGQQRARLAFSGGN